MSQSEELKAEISQKVARVKGIRRIIEWQLHDLYKRVEEIFELRTEPVLPSIFLINTL